MSLLSNPEIIRNARIQLRPRKLLIAGGLCAAIQVALYYAFFHGGVTIDGGNTGYGGGSGLLHMVLIIQAVVLVIGGGIACLHAIQREKDQNTFDFQRLTRLSPWELALGKLFGAPLMVFFVFLCFLPAAIVGAIYARTPATILLAAYVLMILGAIVYDAFALTISLFLRRGAVTWAILIFLAIVAAGSGGAPLSPYLTLGSGSPFVAVSLAQQTSWSLAPGVMHIGSMPLPTTNPFRDLFFGVPVHHGLVLFILYITLFAWLLPAVARNIKHDPTDYELYTPAQSLGFLCYLNFILFAFFQWYTPGAPHGLLEMFSPSTALDTQSVLLEANIIPFFIFGFVLLRNRNQVRRHLHRENSTPLVRLEIWPVPYIFAGVIVVGAAMIGMMEWKRNPSLEWSLALAIYQVIFFAVWLSVDLLFLQWMNLRRGRHPLALGVLCLAVYYVCAEIIVGALHLSDHAFTAILLPTPLFILKSSLWTTQVAEWLVALAAEAAVALFFALLCRRQLAGLQPQSSPVSLNAPAPSASPNASL